MAETQTILKPLVKERNTRLFVSNTPWSTWALHVSGSKDGGQGAQN